MQAIEETVDFIVIGSGGGAFCAGLVCADAGASVAILEKTDKVGGSTAMSGGVLWIPNNPLQKSEQVEDSFEASLSYMQACVGDVGSATDLARREAFLREGPRLIQYLTDKGIPFIRCEGWSDYHDELPGGCARGRSLMVKLFDAKELGSGWHQRLRRGGQELPLQGTESWRLQIPYSLNGMRAAISLGIRTLWKTISGRDLVGFGMALQGRMLQAAIKAGVVIHTNANVVDFCKLNDRVTGVTVDIDGRRHIMSARRGVLINAGGFAHNLSMRNKHGPHPASIAWTNANIGDTGEVMSMAESMGAAIGLMDQAIWLPTSVQPNGTLAWHVFDVPKPHTIMVDRAGKRFLNEGESYMAKGQAMYKHGAIPCFAILDSQHRNRYFWSATPPGKVPKDWISAGYMKCASTVEELAGLCGIDPGGLRGTVDRFNNFARVGRDLDFRRGERTYDRIFADPQHKPNPCLGAIEKPPFYAVEIVPGDVGTAGGLLTDQFARVLKNDLSLMSGLYAVGNSAASVTGSSYPGAGASIAQSFVFGWIAARHALQSSVTSVSVLP